MWASMFFLGFLERWKIGFLDFSLVDFLKTHQFFQRKVGKIVNVVISERAYTKLEIMSTQGYKCRLMNWAHKEEFTTNDIWV